MDTPNCIIHVNFRGVLFKKTPCISSKSNNRVNRSPAKWVGEPDHLSVTRPNTDR